MALKTSFLDMFTNEGRLKNSLNRALTEPDPDASLDQLREMCQRLKANPTACTQLGVYFLDAFFDTHRAPRLTDADLFAVEELGMALSNGVAPPLRPENVWLRVLQVYNRLYPE